MIINGFALYKIIETNNGLAVINAVDKSDRPEVVELIVADAATCGNYLLRYLYARSKPGSTMTSAHKEALADARMITRSWEPT